MSDDRNEIDWERLDRYVSGKVSSHERLLVETDPGLRALAQTMRTAQHLPGATEPNWDAPRAWAAMSRRPTSLTRDPAPAIATRRSWISWAVPLASAALIMIGLMWTTHLRSSVAASRTYTTAAGQRLSLRLSDGTRLTLAPESRLRVPAEFIQGTREVALDGEAYFAVVHDTQHPFAVRAHGVVTQDVGTAFDVRAYDDDSVVRVAVTEGRVSTQGTTLAAGDIAMMERHTLSVTHHADLAMVMAWQQGRLVYQDTPLRDVVRDLDRQLSLHITIADSALAAHQISGSFDHETIDQLLGDITDVIGAQYQRNGRNVVIRPRSTSATQRKSHQPPPLTTVQRIGIS